MHQQSQSEMTEENQRVSAHTWVHVRSLSLVSLERHPSEGGASVVSGEVSVADYGSDPQLLAVHT